MTKRKTVGIVTLLLMLVALPATVLLVRQRQELRREAAAATTLSLLPASLAVQPGDQFSLEVAIDTGSNIVSAADLVITFDSSQLTVTGITAGTFLPVVLVPGAVTSGTATIILGSLPTTPMTGTGVLATVTFTANNVGTATVRFADTTQVAAIGESGNVLSGTQEATVSIAIPTPTPTSTPTPTPTLTPTPTPTPTPIPLPGDIDKNNKVDIFDYNLLLEDFGKTTPTSADIDADGDVDIFDYNLLLENFGERS